MPQSKSPDPYPDVRIYMERALYREHGSKITFPSEKMAFRKKMNAYTVRKRDREQSRRICPEGHPKYDTSIFDALTFQQEGPVLFIRHYGNLRDPGNLPGEEEAGPEFGDFPLRDEEID